MPITLLPSAAALVALIAGAASAIAAETETGAITPPGQPAAVQPATATTEPEHRNAAQNGIAAPAASTSTPIVSPPSAAAGPDNAVANAATPQAPTGAADAAAKTDAPPAADTAAKPNTTPAADTAAKPDAAPAANTAAKPDATPAADAQAAATPAAPAADPVVAAVRAWFAEQASNLKADKDDLAAAVAFYAARTEPPLWVDASGFTAKAKSALAELRRADDWGLSADAFELPNFTVPTPSTAALAEGEARLSLEVLKYARHARGGRVNPQAISRILDQVPPVSDPSAVISDLAKAAAPDTYLQRLHPQHPQFKLLHKALLAARGPAKPVEDTTDPALKVRMPASRAVLKVGADEPEVALLRQRLKVPAKGDVTETMFDEELEDALKDFQAKSGVQVTGQLGPVTRAALNREIDGTPPPDTGRKTQLLVLNMERWRWMPQDLGRVHVLNNIPEFMTRVVKDGDEILKERIIVGLQAWATPVFSAEMNHIVFNPSWGMPNGIKMRELQPRLRAAGGGGDFFSALFGGGGGAAASIRAHGLKVYQGGREISPESVNWGTADVRNYSFIQPPGPKNPLGTVKFMFPNKHDVYMHDTIERPLFAQSSRALSHGCIRVQNPDRFAAVMLAEGNKLDPQGVARARAGGGEVRLKHPIPVHMTYFTAVADEKGNVTTFSDIYGHDSRLSAALTGRALRLDPAIEMSSSEPSPQPAAQKQAKRKKKNSKSAPDTLADAIGAFWLN